MVPFDEDEPGVNGFVIPLGPFELDVDFHWAPREPGVGVAFPIGGPFEGQILGLHLHLIVLFVRVDLFRRVL